MLRLDVHATVDHRLHHLVADVHQLIGRRDREIALLVAQLVAQVRILDAAAIPLALDAIEVVVRFVRASVEAYVVEHEELGLGADVRRVGNAGALQIVHRLAGHVTRIARVILARDRVLNVADHRDRGQRREWIEHGRLGLRH